MSAEHLCSRRIHGARGLRHLSRLNYSKALILVLKHEVFKYDKKNHRVHAVLPYSVCCGGAYMTESVYGARGNREHQVPMRQELALERLLPVSSV